MPTRNPTTAATLRGEPCRRSDRYCGLMVDLIAAGLATLEQFPGQPGNAKTTMHFYRGQAVPKRDCPEDEHTLRIARYGKKFIIDKGITATEQAVRKAEEDIKEADRSTLSREAWRARTKLEFAAQDGPTTAAEYRSKKALVLGFLPTLLASQQGAFKFDFDDEDRRVFQEALDEIAAVLQRAAVVCDKTLAAQLEAIRRSIAAKADVPLQTFLKTIKVRRG